MIERLNAATNLIGLCLAIIGAAVSLKEPNVGGPIITGAFGLLAGHKLGESASGSQAK